MATEEELRNQQELNNLEKERRGISEETLDNIRSASNVLQDQIRFLKFEREERTQIRSISKQISKIAAENYSTSINELGTQKNITSLQKDQTTISEKLSQLLELRRSLGQKGVEVNQDLAESIRAQVEEAVELRRELAKIETESKNISKNFAVKGFAVTEDLVGAIPGLRQFKSTFTQASVEARKVAAAGGSSFKAFTAGAKSIASAAKAALPLLILTEVVKAVMQLDAGIGKVAKQLGISYNQSRLLTRELNAAANASTSLFVTSESIRESFLQINSALGTNARINDELLVTQTELVKQAGYSVETATQLSTLSLATGKSSKDITTEFLGQAKALNIQNDLALNEKQLLESIAKISKGTLATFASQPKELAKAVFEAKKLGLEIAQVERIADGLLDIEQSMTAEFEAEVISGRQLNLERARFFALTNDIAGVSKELGKQGITQASFSKASRIEQQSIAEAMGMSRNEMGEMLIQQSALTKLQGIEGKTAQERFNRLVQEVGLEEAKNRLGDETLANQLASVSTQERFQQIMVKLKDTFVSLVEPLLPVLDIFAGIASFVAEIVGFLSPIIPALMLIGGILTFNPLLITAGVVGVGNQLVSDGIAPASKGPFTITDSYGATAITAKGDGLAVSPNIKREERSPSTNVTVTLSKNDIQEIANAVRDGASKANINVNLDGNRVSNTLQTPLAVNTRKYAI